ncbi:hypothetical protein ES703_29119 [subsurface metagenome]
MGKGMGDGTVNPHFSTNADATDHIANLTNNVISKEAPAIVGKESKNHTVDRHNGTGPHQQFQTGKAAG